MLLKLFSQSEGGRQLAGTEAKLSAFKCRVAGTMWQGAGYINIYAIEIIIILLGI